MMQKKWKIAINYGIYSLGIFSREKSTANSQNNQESIIKIFDGHFAYSFLQSNINYAS